MDGLVRLYWFVVNPAHQTDALVFLALEVFLPVALLSAALWMRKDRLPAAIAERPLCFGAPFLVVWVIPLVTPTLNCLPFAEMGLIERTLRLYAFDLAQVGALHMVMLWPLCVLGILVTESYCAGGRTRFGYGSAVFAIGTLLGVLFYYLWNPRILGGRPLEIEAPTVATIGNLSAIAGIIAFGIGVFFDRFANAEEGEIEVHGDDASEPSAHGAPRMRLSLIVLAFISCVGALAYAVLGFAPEFKRQKEFWTLADEIEAIASSGRFLTQVEAQSYKEVARILRRQQSLSEPHLAGATLQAGLTGFVPGGREPSYVGDGTRYAGPIWKRNYHFMWVAEGSEEEGVRVRLLDSDGTTVRTIAHPVLEGGSITYEGSTGTEKDVRRSTIRGFFFTRDTRAFEDAERLWSDGRGPFVVLLDAGVTQMRMSLYGRNGTAGHEVEADISRVLDLLDAASGSPEALMRLAVSADDIEGIVSKRLLVEERIIDMPRAYDEEDGLPQYQGVSGWILRHRGELVWDDRRRTWTIAPSGEVESQ